MFRDPYLATAKVMTVHSDLALTRFVERNPHQRGIDWATALGILADADYHLEVTEPVYEFMADKVIQDEDDARLRLVVPVTLTLYWAGGISWVTPAAVHEWVTVIQAVEGLRQAIEQAVQE
jgi:hypothetical protein